MNFNAKSDGQSAEGESEDSSHRLASSAAFPWPLAVAAFILVATSHPASAEDPASRPDASTNLEQAVSLQAAGSPVATFRKLLAMTPSQREVFLSRYEPAKRALILAKIREYQALPEQECEMRLRVTELRWYLLPLMKAPPSQRAELLKAVPEPYQELVSSRLDEWDIWPPDLKDEVLEYESVMHYMIGRNAEVRRQKTFDEVPARTGARLGEKLAEFRALPLDQRQQLYGGFRRYFELSDQEQKQILASLPEAERQRTEKVLNAIEQRPKPDQDAYLAAFRKFAEMSPDELREFVNNAQRWQHMSAAERQAWRDLQQQLANSPRTPLGLVPKATGPVPAKTNSAGAH